MIKKLTSGFDGLMRKFTPDPFIYAILLTALVFVSAIAFTDSSLFEVAEHWGQGLWSLAAFTMQMVMILFLGYAVALSPAVKKALSRLALVPKNLEQAAVLTTILSLVGCFLNWGFGLIVAALYCRELGKRFSGKKFPVLVACSYSGFLVWHGGLSGSIPLVVSTPNSFTAEAIGRLMPLSETLFSTINLFLVLGHFICLPIFAYVIMRFSKDGQATEITNEQEDQAPPDIHTPAERLENSSLMPMLIAAIAATHIIGLWVENNFSIDLNGINLILFALALIMHKTPRAFLEASRAAAHKIWPLLIQYPLYAGIMAMMQKTELAQMISNAFVSVASQKTLPILVYLSAGLVNMFVPSGGGQWAVQGPMVINAANQLGADVGASIMAVAWGDAWTNMIQPFWALPLLAIAGLKARDVMSYLVAVFLLSGAITAGGFLLLTL